MPGPIPEIPADSDHCHCGSAVTAVPQRTTACLSSIAGCLTTPGRARDVLHPLAERRVTWPLTRPARRGSGTPSSLLQLEGQGGGELSLVALAGLNFNRFKAGICSVGGFKVQFSRRFQGGKPRKAH